MGLTALLIPGIGPVIGAGTLVAALAGAGVGAAAGGLIGALVEAGVPAGEAGYYAEGLRRGDTLVLARVSDERAGKAVRVMQQHNPVDVERRAEDWRAEGWTGFDPNAGAYAAPGAQRDYSAYEAQDLGPGHSPEPERGSPGLYVDAGEGAGLGRERRPSRDYRAQDVGMGVDLAPGGGQTVQGTGWPQYDDYDAYEAGFRRHYQGTYFSRGYPYEHYEPGYRYGYELASKPDYQGRNWDEVEPEARRRWRERGEGPWEEFQDAVREGWDRVRRNV